jgi:hypothetical protein
MHFFLDERGRLFRHVPELGAWARVPGRYEFRDPETDGREPADGDVEDVLLGCERLLRSVG